MEVINSMTINEGLIKSYPSASLANRLQLQYKNAQIILDREDQNTILVSELFKDKKDLVTKVEGILGYIEPWGYFISNYKLQYLGKDILYFKTLEELKPFITDELGQIHLQLEPKFDKEIEVPLYVYHVTPSKSVDKILKLGLIPKSKQKLSFHPDRVYVFFDIKRTKEVADNFRKLSNGEEEYALLKIDLKNSNIKWHKDPQYRGGGYTQDNIPPSLISIEENPIQD